jgi:hypothetical protein
MNFRQDIQSGLPSLRVLLGTRAGSGNGFRYRHGTDIFNKVPLHSIGLT